MIKKGDKVVMHTCGEAKHYEGIVWTCRTGEQDLCGSPVVWLEGFSGGFASRYLRKVSEGENTVPCVDCNKRILHDSKGYYFYALSGKYCCNECYKKSLKHQEIQREVEQMKITHTVFKNEDLKTLLDKDVLIKFPFEYVQAAYIQQRKKEDKYIVINTDEEPEFIEEIIKVMKRYRKWG